MVPSVNVAFERYIGDLKPCYVKDIGFGAKEAIDIIVRAQGLPVLAHPQTIGDDRLVRRFIEYGVCGIEAYHSDHRSSSEKKYKKMAEDAGLVVTGGSDCHGMGKGGMLMGGIKVPYDTVEKLKEEANRRREDD